MAEEIKATIINERNEEYYDKWIKLPVDQREKFGLVVLYNMGWQKRASGHSYSSRSGHTFVIGMYTKQIIDCVVYSMNFKNVSINQRMIRDVMTMKMIGREM